VTYDDSPEARRRSPGWVRAMTDRQVHGLALRLRREGQRADLTAQQEWLWRCCISELEYRRRRALRAGRGKVCSCELCVAPF